MGVDRKTGILASGDFDILPKLEGAGSSFQLLMDEWLLVNKAKGGNVFVSCHEYCPGLCYCQKYHEGFCDLTCVN